MKTKKGGNKMNRYALIITIIAIIIFQANPAYAKEETALTFEADSLMRDCEIRFKSGNYEGALKMCYRAENIYKRVPDPYGITKVGVQIREIENLLSDNQLAQYYYNIGSDYYLQTESAIDLLEQSKFFGEKCLAAYGKIEGPAGISGRLKCEDLIS